MLLILCTSPPRPNIRGPVSGAECLQARQLSVALMQN